MSKKKVLLTAILILVTLASACNSAQRAEPLLYTDDFSDNTSGWTQSQDVTGTMSYLDGSYQIFVNRINTLLLATPGQKFQGDVSIEVDAHKAVGPDDNYYGVLCRYQDPDNYYLLLISSDGYAGIAMRKAGVFSLISPGLKFLKMNGIRLGSGTNHIRADCIGDTMTLYANGTQVNTAVDVENSFSSGQVGLAARSGSLAAGVDIRFDNFRVYQP